MFGPGFQVRFLRRGVLPLARDADVDGDVLMGDPLVLRLRAIGSLRHCLPRWIREGIEPTSGAAGLARESYRILVTVFPAQKPAISSVRPREFDRGLSLYTFPRRAWEGLNPTFCSDDCRTPEMGQSSEREQSGCVIGVQLRVFGLARSSRRRKPSRSNRLGPGTLGIKNVQVGLASLRPCW